MQTKGSGPRVREGLLKFLEATGHRPRIEAVSGAGTPEA